MLKQRLPAGVFAALLALPLGASAYPGGTPGFVTDVAPYCASCHSSVSDAQLAGAPPERAKAELSANKHIAKIRTPQEGSPYAELTDAQRAELIAGVEAIEKASVVELRTPAKVQAGSVFEVTVVATGGGGPVVGLALVDADQRWQARPAPSAGWHVVDTPKVVGPDGKEQSKFTDGRNKDLAPGIAYVNVYGVAADPVKGQYSTVSMTVRLRAPGTPGKFPLAAAFLYGTEKGSPHGAVETIRGKVPRGGFTANSGRVAFSEVVQVEVEAAGAGE